jgi:DNA-binding PadR family transcriptional regulator
MIRTFILYYLSIKPTHGYEIQKFLQISGADGWTKIQSGSIYYALGKLEREGYIRVLREENTGSRIRKIYEITDAGGDELRNDIQKELQVPIAPVGSDKFLLHNILDVLPKEAIESSLKSHLQVLFQQKEYWQNWKKAKEVDDKRLPAEQIAFEMAIDSLNYQIKWHEEILNHVDQYIALGGETRQVIKSIDFSDVNEMSPTSNTPAQMVEIQRLRDEIIRNPSKAAENIDKIISKLKK